MEILGAIGQTSSSKVLVIPHSNREAPAEVHHLTNPTLRRKKSIIFSSYQSNVESYSTISDLQKFCWSHPNRMRPNKSVFSSKKGVNFWKKSSFLRVRPSEVPLQNSAEPVLNSAEPVLPELSRTGAARTQRNRNPLPGTQRSGTGTGTRFIRGYLLLILL